MTDIKNDFQYEAAEAANKDLGETKEGRDLLSGHLGTVVLDKYEQDELHKSESIRDPLTGAYNLRYLEDRLDEMTAERPIRPFSIFKVDVDNFKTVNDSLGHDFGDEVLKGVVRTLTNHIRPNENGFIARLSGGADEFMVIIPNLSNPESSVKRANDLKESVKESSIRLGREQLHQTVSIGVAIWDGSIDKKQLLLELDKAMYYAKDAGRDSVFFADFKK